MCFQNNTYSTSNKTLFGSTGSSFPAQWREREREREMYHEKKTSLASLLTFCFLHCLLL